jgi:competence CoiA-like predicted nuclease
MRAYLRRREKQKEILAHKKMSSKHIRKESESSEHFQGKPEE